MQRLGRESGRRLTKSMALALASLCLVFLLQVTPHEHTSSHDEAACGLCQAAHVSATPVASGIVLSTPLVPVGEAPIPQVASTLESFIHHSDPRGPPTAVHL
ncbi:MAG: DUF2946 family protein [Candidatus Acidiferrum sp.]